MKTDGLATYLNDHLAGPAFAIAAAQDCAAHTKEAALVAYLQRFIDELREERQTLHRILAALDISADYLKMAVAWAAEKGTRLKLTRLLRPDAQVSELEQLELLRLGVQGKRGMWALLLELAGAREPLAGFQLKELVAQADAQIDTLEGFRLKAGWRVAATE